MRLAEGLTAFFALFAGTRGFGLSSGGGRFFVAFFLEGGHQLLDDGYFEEGGEVWAIILAFVVVVEGKRDRVSRTLNPKRRNKNIFQFLL